MYSLCLFSLTCALLISPTVRAFSICSEPDNLPMSRESATAAPASGFELEVAALLAKEIGEKLETKWVSQRDHSYYRQTIGKGTCDAIMSVPASFVRLTTTTPWYRSTFAFVSRADRRLNLHSLDDLRLRAFSIGVPATGLGDTPPAMALIKRSLASNLKPYSALTPAEGLRPVVEGSVDVAFASGPFASWFVEENNRAGRPKLVVAPTPFDDAGLPLSFEISIGVKKGNNVLKDKLNRALKKNQSAIQLILTKWHVPGMKP